MKYMDRPIYMERLKRLEGTPDIKIITGIRRSGKSKLLLMYKEYLQSKDNVNIIFIDYLDLMYENLKEYHAMYKYVEEHYQNGKVNYLMIDEVQMCPNFELAINSLYNKEKYDIYITGSNAFLLSADLATLFTGRYLEISIFPFSFQEFNTYFQYENRYVEDSFDEYVRKGGFSGAYYYQNEQDYRDYISEVYNTIINRDLIQKYKLADSKIMDLLCDYLMDNIGNLSSPNNIANVLVANKYETNHVTIGKYIKYLCHAFVFYDIKRYDIKGKKYLETSDKFYLCDHGMRYAILGTRNMDFGRIYENIVCIELLRRGYEIYVGKLYQKEIDFIAKKGDEFLYIQVSDDISNPDTFKREYEPLLKIRDAYPKIIIARTRHENYTYEGIHIYNLASWLLEE